MLPVGAVEDCPSGGFSQDETGGDEPVEDGRDPTDSAPPRESLDLSPGHRAGGAAQHLEDRALESGDEVAVWRG